MSNIEIDKYHPHVVDQFFNGKTIRLRILSNYSFTFLLSLGTGKETEETNLLQQLSDACLVVDALEPSVREELVNNFCSREFTSYEQIFEGAGLSEFLFLSCTNQYLSFVY